MSVMKPRNTTTEIMKKDSSLYYLNVHLFMSDAVFIKPSRTKARAWKRYRDTEELQHTKTVSKHYIM
jgi:hypothetical protein